MRPRVVSDVSRAGVWNRAAASSALWRALTPAHRAWALLERAIADATRRRAEDSDRRVEQILIASEVGRLAARMLAGIVRAAQHSAAVRIGRRLFGGFADLTGGGRIRLVARVALVASLTALALQRLSSQPVALGWIVPAATAAGAFLVALLGDACAAAWERRR
jgi:hypothetical protein